MKIPKKIFVCLSCVMLLVGCMDKGIDRPFPFGNLDLRKDNILIPCTEPTIVSPEVNFVDTLMPPIQPYAPRYRGDTVPEETENNLP